MGMFELLRLAKANGSNGRGAKQRASSGRSKNGGSWAAVLREPVGGDGVLRQEAFHQLLGLERRRTERSGAPFALALIDLSGLRSENAATAVEGMFDALLQGMRSTDMCGWYEFPSVVGVIFTTLGNTGNAVVSRVLSERIDQALLEVLEPEEIARLAVTFHFFPDRGDGTDPGDGTNRGVRSDQALYPDLKTGRKSRGLGPAAKRMMDIAGGLVGLILSLPVFLVVPVIIRLTSEGPAIFRQRRIGQFGKEFEFLKFRTMYTGNSSKIHEDYVRRLIDGETGVAQKSAASKGVYKILNDPRVTPVGRFLRMTSLDELPQFWNVLRGDMSLVGPRPPLPYEVAAYRCWHRSRLLEVKPGITGLWQVNGRSSTTFDEMVRLDLRYARRQSFWLDLKILCQTPRAVLSRRGAL